MKKVFFSNLVLIVILNLIVKPFYLFGVDAQIQNTVGAADYGMYFALLNFSFLFNIILDVGLNNYNTKNIAEQPQIIERYLGSILGLKFFLGISYALITLGVALVLGYQNIHLKLLSFLVLNQFLVSSILYFRSNFAGLHWFKTDALMSVLDRILLIGICLVLLYGGLSEKPFQIEWFVYAQTFSYGLTAVIALLITLIKIGVIRPRLKRILSYAILKKSAPYALLILLMMLYSRIDAVMLERLLVNGKEQAGYYAQGFRLLDASNIFALLVAGLLLPIFSRMIKAKENIIPLLRSSGKLLIGIALLVSIVCSYFSFAIMDIIYNHGEIEAAKSFPWIISSFVPMASTYIFGTLLTANGSLKQLNIMATFGLVLNISLNFWLIPNYEAEGASIATFCTQLITAIWQIVLVLRIFDIGIHKKSVLQLFIFTIFLLVTVNIMSHFLTGYTYYLILISLLIGVIGLFALKIIEFSFVDLIKSKLKDKYESTS
jgi:O-antigen/teichoic acid export membrane protein